MILAEVYDYAQSFGTPLVLEFYYYGEKIEDPAAFFAANEGLYETAFPSLEETQVNINKYAIFCDTHKLVVSEFGFNLVFL
jgi:hypothetical protein